LRCFRAQCDAAGRRQEIVAGRGLLSDLYSAMAVLWRASPALSVVAVVTIALLAFGRYEWSLYADAIRVTLDAGHLPAFLLFAAVTFNVISGHTKQSPYRATALLCLIIILLIELLQPLVGRTPSFADIALGITGVALTLSGYYLWRDLHLWWPRVLHGVLLLAVTVVIALPVWQQWQGIWRQYQQFPLLGDFEQEADLIAWRAQGESSRGKSAATRSADHATHGQYSLRVSSVGGDWSGVNWSGIESDWRNYQQLAFDVYNPAGSFKLHVRIDDDSDSHRYEARYNSIWNVRTGWNAIAIRIDTIAAGPRWQPLNMRAIRRVVLFTGKNASTREFYLDDIRLE